MTALPGAATTVESGEHRTRLVLVARRDRSRTWTTRLANVWPVLSLAYLAAAILADRSIVVVLGLTGALTFGALAALGRVARRT